MKKKAVICLTGTVIAALLCISVSAGKEKTAAPLVSVTVHQAGNVLDIPAPDGGPAAGLSVAVTDADRDGSLSVNDALMLVHQLYYGDMGGYAYEKTEYGYSMTKIWGITEGVGAFYRNGEMPWTDVVSTAVSDGDKIDVILYDELWSDVYAAFDRDAYVSGADVGIPMRLSYSAFDENWDPYFAPLASGTVSVLKKDGSVLLTAPTDKNGCAVLKVGHAGEYRLALSGEGMTLDSYASLTVLPFGDIPYDTWYTEELLYTWKRGLLPEENKFRPDEGTEKAFVRTLIQDQSGAGNGEVTRGDVLSMLLAADVYSDFETARARYGSYDISVFADAGKLNETQRVYAAWAYDKGLLCGRLGADGKRYAALDETATRAESMAFAARALQRGMYTGAGRS